ncbi:uncharacterized protein J4E78_002728 [Alternaria triticimaculans]|uniref:uncharacterized protein n=1 Tax=Alternaria triticimaculans TaxID=297637 RepID=UPI0020C26953|nr:uncharacterized protein J4E78_002728 [Alternaria triticimaculans]KAI4665268.1 hypothetical protein J4E78_002728 [Alternaria triticimaculans]
MSALLLLPRELRNHIYDYYFSCDGGYTHVFETNQLRRADNQPIELSLVLSCRQIAAETHGLALRINTLRFTTFHSDATQEQAGLLHAVNKIISSRKESLLNSEARELLGEEQAQIAKKAYPQFTHVIDHWQSHGRINGRFYSMRFLTCGEAPSVWRDFVAFTLNLVSHHPGFVEKARIHSKHSDNDNECHLLNKAGPKPWRILDDVEIATLQEFTRVCSEAPCVWPSTKYAYSAASIALRFLHSLPTTTREDVRKILLLEDRESISFPESHGRGFIAICQKHPQLMIERFVSLWKNVLPVQSVMLSFYLDNHQSYFDDGYMDNDQCPAKLITKAVGAWVKEAMCLPELGMPHGSFTLVLDGDPCPELSSRAFRIVQRDVAWQTALDTCYALGHLPQPSWLERRLLTAGYMFEGLPEAVGHLSMTDPLIRTNFPVESPYDVEELLRDHEDELDVMISGDEGRHPSVNCEPRTKAFIKHVIYNQYQ